MLADLSPISLGQCDGDETVVYSLSCLHITIRVTIHVRAVKVEKKFVRS